MTQPINSGAPQPVSGVTGGPPVLGGQIGNDPNSGNVVINPNPGNAVEVRASPSTFNVYEYFHTSTDNVRIALETALNGPEFIGIRTAPPAIARDLQIGTTGNLILQAGSGTQWTISTTGNLVPQTDNTQSIGNATHRIALLYASALAVGTPPLGSVGAIRMNNGNPIVWRDAGNTVDITLTFDSLNRLTLNNVATQVGNPGTPTGSLPVVIGGVLHQLPYV